MYRVTKMGSGIYAIQIDSVNDDIENIESLLEEGDHVLLVNDLDDAAKVFDVETSEIIVVEPE